MASVATHRAAPRAERSLAQRLTPAEGWITVLLHLVIVLAAAWAISRAGWAPRLTGLIPVALVGVAAGFAQAKARMPDMLAHAVAVALGCVVAIGATVGILADLGLGYRARLHALWMHGQHWYQQAVAGKQVDDIDLFVLVMAITLWLVAYSSAWMLYRRRWLAIAVLMPGVMILINLAYAPRTGSAPLVAYLLATLILAARHFGFRRQQEWQQSQIPAPSHLSWHFLNAGVTIALLVVLLGWTMPLTGPDDLLHRAWERVDSPWHSLEARWNDWFGSLNVPGRTGGGIYPDFGESFRLGGPLNLGDQPVLILKAQASQYIVGHRYDRYDGHGWESDVAQTFDPIGQNGHRYAPQVTFQPDQPVHLSADVATDRTQVRGTVTLIRPKQDLLLTTGTYLASDQPTSVQLSWQQVKNLPINVQSDDQSATPPDLYGFVLLLRQARFQRTADGTLAPSDPDLAREIAQGQSDLAQRFLTTHWDIAANGRVTTLYVSGQLPVYDDVEAVFDQVPPRSGMTYSIVGLDSTATPDELRAAGTDYPAFVAGRYLQLPTTITPRTVALAQQVTAGLNNPFDKAVAIQDYVRTHITYTEDIPYPPGNQDVVDYVLFDSKEGYCEYYASAMAVMLRTLDIPTRMVVGYYPAPYDPGAAGFVYREKYAHAWVEVYFPDYGWLPFEPTASRQPLAYGGDAQQRTPQPTPEPTPEATAVASPAADVAVAPTPTPVPPVVPPSASSGGHSLLGQHPGPLGWASRIGGALVALALVLLVAVWLWGLRGLSPAGGFYARVLRFGRFWGVRRDPAMTPLEFAEELGRNVPAAREPARVVARLYVAEQYGGHAAEPATANAGRTAWHRLRRLLLLRGFGRRTVRRGRSRRG